ncbi:early E1A 25 kDa protein [bat adenovirus 3]|uniref:Early E1A 25 kDa protein n=1 Tax=bat adenovirus 3 TaxID=2758098 RepID=D3X7A8_9ADEN|nr:early E1A 25 kDa protein [bat adenovirus 3]ADD17097.1 early E1A 25 kDa protein [bat adenovirus 3]
MICPVPPAGLDLDSFVADLLQEWAPDCEFVDVSPSPPSPPSLLDLFDVSEADSPTPEDDDVVVVADSPASDTESCVCLSTPPVSPITVYSASPNVTEDMLQCLEDMATFDEDDEVRSEASSFTGWSDNVDVASCPAQGCLRCAFYQSRGESAICGLCYLKALSAVSSSRMPLGECHGCGGWSGCCWRLRRRKWFGHDSTCRLSNRAFGLVNTPSPLI